MIALKITDTRDFMKRLLASEQFDTFLFSEGTVTTFTTYTIDGTWHPDYYEDQDPDAQSPSVSGESIVPNALTWKLLRPVFFDIIKGKHTPVSFRIILRRGKICGVKDYTVALTVGYEGGSVTVNNLSP